MKLILGGIIIFARSLSGRRSLYFRPTLGTNGGKVGRLHRVELYDAKSAPKLVTHFKFLCLPQILILVSEECHEYKTVLFIFT